MPARLFQKQLIGFVIGLVPVRDLEAFQKCIERSHVSLVDLETHQYPAEVGAVITVVEQADVPAVSRSTAVI